jgi:hypothetical protein
MWLGGFIDCCCSHRGCASKAVVEESWPRRAGSFYRLGLRVRILWDTLSM